MLCRGWGHPLGTVGHGISISAFGTRVTHARTQPSAQLADAGQQSIVCGMGENVRGMAGSPSTV